MTTRDLPGAPPAGMNTPAEVRQGAGQLPASQELPSVQASPPTPGAALAGARVPGAPTLPEWDPSSLSLLVSRMANDLFSAPPAGAVPASAEGPATVPANPTIAGAAPAQSMTAVPSMSSAMAPPQVPSSAAVPSSDISAAFPLPPAVQELGSMRSPFSIAPSFDSISAFDVHPAASETLPNALSFPVLDEVATPPAAVAPVTPSAPAAPTMPAPSFDKTAFQIEPAVELPMAAPQGGAFDAYAIRREFPILEQRVNGRRLVWLDNAATTQKPRAVIDRISTFYERENSNIHRAAHTLAGRASDAYEQARETSRRFINAGSVKEIVFVRGTTEGINLVAQSWGRRNVKPGDEVLITWLEHHANIVPWQMLCAEVGATLKVAPVDDTGQVILSEYEKLLGPRTKIVALPQVSNALGTVTPAQQMVEMAHRHGARVLVDGAQSVSHMRADVQALDCDFFVFSGHKVFAPTGIGVVYGKQAVLDEMPPWQGGGNMIQDVTFERTLYQPAPARFEAGTGNIADAVGLGAALDWVSRIGIENIGRHEHDLIEYAERELVKVPGLTIIGSAPGKAGVVSFILAGQKTEEVSGLLDKEGIAVRSGHHCAQPILRRFGLEATVRASFAPYNVCEDVDALVAALERLQAGRRA